jgi:hypothetical protein
MESRESQQPQKSQVFQPQGRQSQSGSGESKKNRRMSWKKFLQERPDLQFLEEDIRLAMNRGLIADSVLVLLHNGRMDLIDPVPPPENIKEFLRSADRKTLQGTIIETLFWLFEKLEKKDKETTD